MRDGVRARLESVMDAAGSTPAVNAPGGGTRLFRDQAACPFRGFVAFRLYSKPIETPRPGLDARERGTLVHCMLAAVWRENADAPKLAALSGSDLEGGLHRAPGEAFSQRPPPPDALDGPFGRVEHPRL